MLASSRALAPFVISIFVAACTSVPGFNYVGDEAANVPISTVVNHVACELYWANRATEHVETRGEEYYFTTGGWSAGKTTKEITQNGVKRTVPRSKPTEGLLAYYNFTVVVSLNLKVDDASAIAPSLNFIHNIGPTPAPDTFNWSVGGQVNAGRQRIYAQTFAFNVAELANSTHVQKLCKDPTPLPSQVAAADEASSTGDTPRGTVPASSHEPDDPLPEIPSSLVGVDLVGDFGLKALVTMALQSIDKRLRVATLPKPTDCLTGDQHGGADGKTPSCPAEHSRWAVAPVTLGASTAGFANISQTTQALKMPAFGSIIQFSLVKSANGGPTWIRPYFKGPSGTTGLFSWTRTDTNQLVMAFAPGEPGDHSDLGLLRAIGSIPFLQQILQQTQVNP